MATVWKSGEEHQLELRQREAHPSSHPAARPPSPPPSLLCRRQGCCRCDGGSAGVEVSVGPPALVSQHRGGQPCAPAAAPLPAAHSGKGEVVDSLDMYQTKVLGFKWEKKWGIQYSISWTKYL